MWRPTSVVEGVVLRLPRESAGSGGPRYCEGGSWVSGGTGSAKGRPAERHLGWGSAVNSLMGAAAAQCLSLAPEEDEEERADDKGLCIVGVLMASVARCQGHERTETHTERGGREREKPTAAPGARFVRVVGPARSGIGGRFVAAPAGVPGLRAAVRPAEGARTGETHPWAPGGRPLVGEGCCDPR